MRKIPIVAVVGPTASGKTALSVSLAKRFDAEIISADSMQIYKGMDIATAKPSKKEMQGVVHHLIDFADTQKKFSVAQYLDMARSCVSQIDGRGKKAIVVGGTGLYVNSLVDNILFEQEENNFMRSELSRLSANELFERLKVLDPEYADKLNVNDRTRIIRGIEINLKFGHNMKEHLEISRKQQSPYKACLIGINFRDRQKLYDKIDARVDKMAEEGLIDEASFFFGKLNGTHTAVQAIGYKELFPYLEGKISLDAVLESLKKATRNYAKRQLTWFRKDPRINWLYADELTKSQLEEKAAALCISLYKSFN